MKKPAILLLVLLILACFHACEEPVEPQDPIPPPSPLPNYEGYYIGKSQVSDFREIQVFWEDTVTQRIMDSMFVYKDTSYMRVDTIEVRKVEGDTVYMVNWKGAVAGDLFYQNEDPKPFSREAKHHINSLNNSIRRSSSDFDPESYSIETTGFGTEDSLISDYHYSDFTTPNYGYLINLSFEATRRDSLD